jgi:hypothetical protein
LAFAVLATTAFPIPNDSAPTPKDKNSFEYFGAMVVSCACDKVQVNMAIERLIDLIIKILFITITNSLTKNCVLCQLDLH